MKQIAALLTLFALVSVSAADEFVGIFLQGQRIGYIHTVVSTTPDGKTSTLTATRIGAKVLGQGMSMAIISKSLRKGAILERQELTIESAGRTQNVTATYTVAEVDVTRVSGETMDKRTLQIPVGAVVLDDPTVGLLGKGAPEPGTKLEFYILDPMTLTLVKNEAEYLGVLPYKGVGVEGTGMKLKIVDPRATTEIWLDKDGAMAFATGPLGMTMKPITRAEAVGSDTYMPEEDIASASRIVPDKPIENPASIRSLSMRIKGTSLPRLTSDYYQTVERGEDGIVIAVHPLEPPAMPTTIAAAGKAQPTFTRGGLNMPVDSTEMKALAKQIVGAETNPYIAAQKISSHVFRIMKPNASIGVLRDAREILKTKEGVCRDYATLAATLMRSAGIPTKLVTGAVYSGDAFYYHAWVEGFVGDRWIAFDPTMGGGLADATHIKFAEGNFEEAFITFTLDGNKIEVLKIVRK
ncbi:MAG: transglutaminase-like domain-containing protein [Armatimonadota bacterium]|nr:transglutaminase-like domain-containing protein [Armatimonadota bacterium]